MACVEGGEGGGDFDGGGFVIFEGGVVACEFVGFVVEVLQNENVSEMKSNRRAGR